MRIFIALFAVAVTASAASIASDYIPPLGDNSLPSQEFTLSVGAKETTSLNDGYHYQTVRKLKLRHRRDVNELPANEYLPPTEQAEEEEVAVEQPAIEEDAAPSENTELAKDGYRYKTVRRLKYRHRRDVSELPADKYLPPSEQAEEIAVEQPVLEQDLAPEEKSDLAEDGYRYKTVRRLKYRQRRDVNELPANEYLPSNQQAQEEDVAVEQSAMEEDAAPSENTELTEDGYRYKTVRRLKYRHRRDVSELPANEYLPPTEQTEEIAVEQPVPEQDLAPEEKTELAEDGYRYKTIRRLKYRHRRDVNELPANEYLPPTEQAAEIAVEQPVVPEEKSDLSEDGYRYKTVRRLKYRHRRDVSEVPANEYLPPTEQAEEIAVEQPVSEQDLAPEENTELAEDGYRYKTVHRLKYRHRRDVNELPANEYLSPTEQAAEIAVEQPVVPEEKSDLSEDGYRYKTVRRLKYRHRRDVSEVPANEYLPPTEQAEEIGVEQPVSEQDLAPEEKTELAEDGYRYKTVHRLKYRHRRDVNELPANEYLPPTEQAAEIAVEQPVVPEEKSDLSEDGYRYKTVRRLKYRHRRDVNELPANEYLPPTEQAEEIAVEQPVAEQDSAPEEKSDLAEDGYRYKTVRRLKYRHRRDVSEVPANEYLPPTEQTEEIAVEQPVPKQDLAPEEKTELAEDGYRYKTVRRLKYRHRRDVNELPANEYLPPTEQAAEIAVEQPVVPEEKSDLSEDGYRYKTVRRLKYRHRRDVNELPANEYLPPTEQAEEIAVEQPIPEQDLATEENTELGKDGYRYKTVRRLKYRHRRDVSEVPANEYLPPTEQAEEIGIEQPVAEQDSAPEKKSDLAEDGYRYKTVRRLKYRHRRDVNELSANEYLPPNKQTETEEEEVAVEQPSMEEDAAPSENTELAKDGYRYKTVRRLKYRHRRDVSEFPANEYLPPTEQTEEEVAVEQPNETSVLTDDGYHYKTVRRLKLRRH